MKILFIGDIVGRPARESIKYHLQKIRDEHNIDLVIANVENASHGFGITKKNAQELFSYGIDVMSGGNHTFDKKDIYELLKAYPQILRPNNYPKGVVGSGVYCMEILGEKLAVVNLMGSIGMPNCDNPFTHAKELIKNLKDDGYKNIFIDFHAEATAEKRTLYAMLKDDVSAICGTHTHIGTDDMSIENGCFYVSDVGMSGCRDGVIGMRVDEPIQRALSAISSKFDIDKKCKSIFQMIILELKDGECKSAYKLKAYDKNQVIKSSDAYME